MRYTQDEMQVFDTDMVWEILFRYLNPETSVAEPETRMVKLIPPQARIWAYHATCEAECRRLNDLQRSPPYIEHPIPAHSLD
jgi:hypothetical protein